MFLNDTHLNMINSPVRRFQGKVELYDSTDALAATYTHLDDLKSFQVERVGEGKFFGYGYVQKVNIKLLDTKREKKMQTSNKFKVYVGVSDTYVPVAPTFKVTETNRDEKTNALSITAYDKLKAAADNKYSSITAADEVTLYELACAIASHLGIETVSFVSQNSLAQTSYTKELLNLAGDESLRDVLDWIAEVTQTIYYLNRYDELIFRQLDKDGAPAYTISKERYVELKSKDNRRLAKITKATSLGDNVYAALSVTGTNQIMMDNPLLELRDDVASLLEAGAETILGLTVNQFECDWRGNYLLDIGDKIALECKDGSVAYSYLLEDKFLFNGGIEQESEWKWDNTQNEDETNSNPSTIGEALNKTYARVDKVNKEIELLVSEVAGHSSQITMLQLKQDEIQASVESEIDGLTQRVEQTITKDEMNIAIQEAVKDAESSEVTTSTGFTFNAEGLNITKSGSEMSTLITEDGLRVSRNGEVTLSANNEGVKAEDLHATTYLLIGENSRFEDYDNNKRTGCFWIGKGGEN
jgi:hypothetical protein